MTPKIVRPIAPTAVNAGITAAPESGGGSNSAAAVVVLVSTASVSVSVPTLLAGMTDVRVMVEG